MKPRRATRVVPLLGGVGNFGWAARTKKGGVYVLTPPENAETRHSGKPGGPPWLVTPYPQRSIVDVALLQQSRSFRSQFGCCPTEKGRSPPQKNRSVSARSWQQPTGVSNSNLRRHSTSTRIRMWTRHVSLDALRASAFLRMLDLCSAVRDGSRCSDVTGFPASTGPQSPNDD